MPPVLLRIKTEDHDVQFGGFPYHMILLSHTHHGVFYIKTLYEEETVSRNLHLFFFELIGIPLCFINRCETSLLKFRIIYVYINLSIFY